MGISIRLLVRYGLAMVLVALSIVIAACSSAPAPTPQQSGPAAKLVFTAQPGAAVAGAVFSIEPVVAVEDVGGNIVTGYMGLVVLTITKGTGASEARLFGATAKGLVNGVVRFKDLSIDKAESGYTLSATSGNLAPAVSAPFSVAPGPAAMVSFTRQPQGATAGSPFAVQPVVAVEDSQGNIVPNFTGPVTLVVMYGRAALSGTATVKAVNGVATFTGVSMNKAGSKYALLATGDGLVPDTSSLFEIVPGPATKLVFAVQPDEAIAGSEFNVQPVVEVEDVYDNIVTSSKALVNVGITPNSGTPGAVLSGTTKVSAANGEADFADLSVDKAGPGYTLTATSDNLASAVSSPFDVSRAPASK